MKNSDLVTIPRLAMTVTYDKVKTIDLRYGDDVIDAINGMSMTELHRLRVAMDKMDKGAFFDLIVGVVNHNRSKR
jgi:hypothetical protein